jgi:hypothetical protein
VSSVGSLWLVDYTQVCSVEIRRPACPFDRGYTQANSIRDTVFLGSFVIHSCAAPTVSGESQFAATIGYAPPLTVTV